MKIISKSVSSTWLFWDSVNVNKYLEPYVKIISKLVSSILLLVDSESK